MKSGYIEIGNYCHAKCISCNIDNSVYVAPNISRVYSRLEKLINSGFTKIRLTGKEPVTSPEFSNYVEFLKNSNIQVSIATTLLTKSMEVLETLSIIDELRISIHGFYDEYEKFMGVNKFERFTKNLDTLVSLRKSSCMLSYTFVKSGRHTNFSYGSWERLKTFLKEYPIEVEFFPMHNNWNKIELSRMHNFTNINNLQLYKNQYHCAVHDRKLYVKYNGDVYPCCMAGGEVGGTPASEVYLGNIDRISIEEIQRKKLINLNNEICRKCTPKYYKLME